MSRIYITCAILGVVGGILIGVVKGPYEAFYFVLGALLSMFNLRAISQIVGLMLNGGGYAIIPLVLLKLLVVFAAIGFLLYYYQALYVIYLVAGLSTLVVAIASQGISDFVNRRSS